MARVFLSHASEDEELVDEFVDLLETGVGLRGNDVYASSIEGRDTPSSVDYRAYIKQELAGAAAVVFLLSAAFYDSPFCMAELGAAWGLDSDVFLLVVPPLSRRDISDVFGNVEVESVTAKRSLHKLATFLRKKLDLDFDIGRWDAKCSQFVDWVRGRPDSGTARRLTSGDDRGWWDKSIVDGTLYIGNSYTTIDIKSAIIRDIAKGSALPTVYAYLTNSGYRNWLSLTEDPGYAYFRDAMRLYEQRAPTLAAEITNAVGSRDLDVISLGPGNGRKDLLLLRALAGREGASSFYYYPFDVNSSMISSSMKLVGGDARLEDIKVKAILAEFDALPQFRRVYQYRSGPNVLLLLGNTLGNLPNDRQFLDRIYKRAMGERDLLVLEIRNLHVESDPETDLGAEERNKRFDFGPLEYVGVPFEANRLEYEELSARQSLVEGTRTVAAKYAGCVIGRDEYTDITLSLINRYDPEGIVTCCEEVGFKVLNTLTHRSATTLVLQK
jgi:hypothetical protein